VTELKEYTITPVLVCLTKKKSTKAKININLNLMLFNEMSRTDDEDE